MKPKNVTNSLKSHHGESACSKPSKMGKAQSEYTKAAKKFFNRKNRMMLKNPKYYDKI